MKKIFPILCFYRLLLIAFPTYGNQFLPEQKFDSIEHLLGKYHYSHATLSRDLAEQLYRIAHNHPENPSLLVKAIYWETYVEYSQGKNIAVLIPRINSLLSFYKDKGMQFEYGLLIYSRALANMAGGNYAEAFQNAIWALEIFERLNQRYFTVRALVTLGNICPSIRNYNMAESYYNQALEMVTPMEIEYYQIKLNLFRILFLRDEISVSIDSHVNFIPEVLAFGDTSMIVSTYLNLGACYSNINLLEESFECYRKVSDYMAYLDNKSLNSAVYLNSGIYYFLCEEYERAYDHLNEAKCIAIRDDNIELLSYILYALSGTFESMSNLDSAYYYLKEYDKLNEQIMNDPKAVEVYQSYVSIFMESSQNKLRIAEQELLLRDRQVAVIIISAAGIILAVVFLLIISFQKRRNIRQKALLKEIENKDLSERLQHEHEMQRLQSEKLEAQIREITSYSLLLSSKNHLLQQILCLSKQLSNNPDKLESFNSRIEEIVQNNLNTESDWNHFMLHFDKVHPKFFDKLQLQCPNLTKNDLKLSAYIRIGMSTKQIAQILNLVPDSVKINRHRLKKKLKLKENENLEEYIHSL